jgi:hypothetical protein
MSFASAGASGQSAESLQASPSGGVGNIRQFIDAMFNKPQGTGVSFDSFLETLGYGLLQAGVSVLPEIIKNEMNLGFAGQLLSAGVATGLGYLSNRMLLDQMNEPAADTAKKAMESAPSPLSNEAVQEIGDTVLQAAGGSTLSTGGALRAVIMDFAGGLGGRVIGDWAERTIEDGQLFNMGASSFARNTMVQIAQSVQNLWEVWTSGDRVSLGRGAKDGEVYSLVQQDEFQRLGMFLLETGHRQSFALGAGGAYAYHRTPKPARSRS